MEKKEKQMDDLMREQFKEIVHDLLSDDDSGFRANMIIDAADEYAESMAPKWIPFKTRPLTEKEKEEHPEWDCFLDCELPDDGQEILVTYKAGNKKEVCEDTFFNDDCCYLDSGLELGEEVLAWTEKPAPWEGE